MLNKKHSNEITAIKFMKNLNDLYASLRNKYTLAEWQYSVDLTDENLKNKLETVSQIYKKIHPKIKQLNKFNWTEFSDSDLKRQYLKFSTLGIYALPKPLFLRHSELVSLMKGIYGKATICKYMVHDSHVHLDPEINELMATSRDPEELKHLWIEWRKATGEKMRELFIEYVDLSNEVARVNNFTSNAEFWLNDFESSTIEKDLEELWLKVRPLYLELHCYVRRKLKDFYGKDTINNEGLIPSHLLGNIWGQTWENIYNFTAPFPENNPSDITSIMLTNKFTPLKMFEMAENFFISLGMNPMPASFWTKSVIEKLEGKEMICHASAWDFFDGKDFRIKMCTKVNQADFQTVHHEMGHIQYAIQYKNQPAIFREGANSAFHEAVGDLISLSVMSPNYLSQTGLLLDDDPSNNEKEINLLYHSALMKVAPLPFLYLIDLWRWEVFRGTITSNNYNSHWHHLRAKYQGVVPPENRSEKEFDPGAKYHIAADVPYIRYFLSFLLQFQLHKGLTELSDPMETPLHRRTIHRNLAAGNILSSILKSGSSKAWPEVLEAAGFGRSFTAEPILEYYDPLFKWLTDHNKEAGNVPGWTIP